METRSRRVNVAPLRWSCVQHVFRPRWKFLCGVQIAFRAVSSGRRRPFVTADSGQTTYKPTTLIMTPRRLTTSSSCAHSWSNIHAFTRSSSFSSLSVIVFLTEYIPLYSHRAIPCHLGRTYTTRVHGSLTPTLSVYPNRNNERYRVNAKLIRSNYPLLEVRPSKVTALQMTGCHRCNTPGYEDWSVVSLRRREHGFCVSFIRA